MSLFAISEFQDLESFWINNQIETLNLEYKSQISTNEVAKDVSSFANSEGGTIIYGMEEDQGRAKESSGIDKGQNSERIQQIVSSSTAPEVPMTIDVIDNSNENTKEFLVVKIPKSPFYIHQVTTSSKFYVRNNTTTTPHEYNPMEMKENDIALRYEARYRNKQNQESFIQKKETKLFRELNWGSGAIISLVPHVRVPGSFKITKEMFRGLFVHPTTSIVSYDNLPTDPDIPSSEGRMTDPSSVRRVFVEIDNDGSIYCCRINGGGFGMTMFDPIFLSGELLHLLDRLLKKRFYYGGTTLRIRLVGSLEIREQDFRRTFMENLPRTVSNFEIEHELPVATFDRKEELTKIFVKWFEALHIDNSLAIFPSSIPEIESRWVAFDQRTFNEDEVTS